MENNMQDWRRLLHIWTGPPDNDASHTTLREKTAIDDEKNVDKNSDDGLGRPSEVLGRSGSFEDTSASSDYSRTDALTHEARQFPPPVGAPMLVQPQRPPGRDSTPKTLKEPFSVPPKALMDPQGQRTASYPEKAAGSRRPQPISIPGRANYMPPSPTHPESASSSYSEVESYAGGESPSLSNVQTISHLPGAEPRNGGKELLHFDTSYTSDTDGGIDSLTGREDADPLKLIWWKLMDKKEEVRNMRSEIRETRKKLKGARVDKDDADNAFMAHLRPLLANAPLRPSAIPGDPLVQLISRMQETRDQYYEYETLLEALEDRLGLAENQLDTLERQFLNELRAAPVHPFRPINSSELLPPPDKDGVVGSNIHPPQGNSDDVGGFGETTLPVILLGIGAERAEDYHPLYNQFMSVIGYFQLAQEHHHDLLMRKQLIEEEQQRSKLAEEQKREQRKLTEEQKQLRLTKKHEEAQLRLAEEYERQRSRLFEEQAWERSRLAEEAVQSSSPLRARPLRDEDLEFLRDFEVDERVASEEVRRLRNEVEQFKQLCQEKGVIPRYAPLHEVYSYERNYEDDISIDFDPQNADDKAKLLVNPRFPLLLSSPSHLLGEFPVTAKAALRQATKMSEDDPRKAEVLGAAAKEFFIENLIHDSREYDKSDFINRWLLYKLRTSPLEAELLYNCFFMWSHLRILNLDQWQQDVLYYWPRDDAAKIQPETFLGPVTPEGTQTRVGSSTTPPRTAPSQSAGSFDKYTSVSS